MNERPEPLPAATPSTDVAERRSYEAPKLVHLGSVRDLTLGNSGHRTDVGTRTRK